MKIVCGATVAAYKCDGKEELIWLKRAEELAAEAETVAAELSWFLAAETTGPHGESVGAIAEAVRGLGGEVWTFEVNRRESLITTDTRAIGVDVGRNLINRYATAAGADRLLMMDTDIDFPPETIPALLEIGEHPTVGLHVPQYCLDGPAVEHPTIDDLREHWTTAGCLMMTARVAERVMWRRDQTHGWSDDPAFQHDVQEIFGTMTWVRHDVAAHHVPPLVAIEERHSEKSRALT